MLALALVPAFGHAASELKFPERPIHLVTPFPPGGGTDAVARILADKLGNELGQPVIVENKGGAGGTLGTNIAAKAAPDGYTIVLGSSATHAINPSLYPNLTYDPVSDFTPISTVATTPLLLMVNASLPVQNVSDLIELSKSKVEPDSLTFASAGVGSAQHLGAEMFKSITGATFLHIPYKGAGPAMVDLLAGHVDVMFDTMPSALPQVKSDKLKVLGISSPARNRDLPDIPAIGESVPNYEVVTWYGIFSPKETPEPIVQKLNDAIKAVLNSDDVKRQFKEAGIEPSWSTPNALMETLQQDIPKWRSVIENSGARIE
ncbi:MAG: tripartite tricarboxylate transporter substrate binding protein [Castellaniella sp.]